jgi:hypothetical protein
MLPHGQTKLGFFPLPVAEAKRLRNTQPDPASLVEGRGRCQVRSGVDGQLSRSRRHYSTSVEPTQSNVG